MADKPTLRKPRGFAALDPVARREIAGRGGKAAHQKGTAHEFTTEEARAAGRKGGEVAQARGTAHRFTSSEAREAARKRRQSAPPANSTDGSSDGQQHAPPA
jgi:general stress protein YciG